MSDPGFASLGPSLLARKGGAKPAMRPQVAPLVATQSAVPDDQLEDLGWNDMGDSDLSGGADVVPIKADMSAASISGGPGPIIRRHQRRLEERVLAEAAMTGSEDPDAEYDEDDEPVYGDAYDVEAYDEHETDEDAETAIYSPLTPHIPAAAPAPAKVRVSAAQSGRRAAFTLRLDADRHLKLRLAATMQGVSAQVLVTEALDRLLAEYDDLDIIAHHLKRH